MSPALGVDALSGFFLLVLAITAVPALAFAHPYLRSRPSSGAVGVLTAAFLLALAGLLAARDVTTFLGFWELMTLVPAAAILVVRRDAAVRSAVFAYLAITHIGGAGVWVALLVLAHHGALADPEGLVHAGTGAQTLVAIASLIGFGTKAGLVPLHSWLPRAHPVAPAARSRFAIERQPRLQPSRLPQLTARIRPGPYADLATKFTTSRGALQRQHRHDHARNRADCRQLAA